jgi:hypothetical protein
MTYQMTPPRDPAFLKGSNRTPLLGGGLKVLENLFPGFGEELRGLGAEPIAPGSDMLFEIPGQDLWPRIKFSWHTIRCRDH